MNMITCAIYVVDVEVFGFSILTDVLKYLIPK